MALIQQVLQAQAAIEGHLLAKKNVVGVAVGFKESHGVMTDELALIALVNHKETVAQLAPADLVPQTVDGIQTDVYEVGDLRALSSINPTEATGRYRPTIPAGVSMGHYRVTAGTFGAVVRDRVTNERLLLSNNHVFANSNDASNGDSILQPSMLDGGQTPADMVARLERFIPLRYIEDANQPQPEQPGTNPNPGGEAPGCVSIFVTLANLIAGLAGSKQTIQVTSMASASSVTTLVGTGHAVTVAQALTPDNAVDAALAKPVNQQMIEDIIQSIGQVSGTKLGALGMQVRKSGRTTGLTTGRITLLNATINITYDTSRGPRTARFVGQTIADPMSQGGDSGSLVVDATENKAVGLLFAGSAVATVFTPIDTVLAALNVTI